MKPEQPRVHGSIFFLLKKYVEHNFPKGTWEQLNTTAGISHQNFELTQSYPIQEIGSIIMAASTATGLTANELKERFGEYLVPDLFALYANYLQPDWKTFDVLLNTEEVMHGAVRQLNSTANPPILSVTKVSNKLLVIDYYSKRRMGALAVGIIKGIAKHFHEESDLQVVPMTDPDAERVQIRVEFK